MHLSSHRDIGRTPVQRREAVGVLVLVMMLLLAGMPGAEARGSRNLYPNGATGSRASLDWQNTTYAGTNYYGGGTLKRHTLLRVYAQQNEYIVMGSSAVGIVSGATVGNILAYNPGTVTGPPGDEEHTSELQ